MSLHKEISFENDICEHLAQHGWLYAEGDALGYDRARALFPADLLAWVQATQPNAWEILTKNNGAQAGETILTLRQQATNNTKEQFANSPDLKTELLNAIMGALDAHTAMSTQALNSETVRQGIRDILLNNADLYETLRGRADK